MAVAKKKRGRPSLKDLLMPEPEVQIASEVVIKEDDGLFRGVSGRLYKPMDFSIKDQDMVNNPAHYTVGGIETIDFIEAKKLGYNLGNAVKYISRADYKGKRLEDLKKAEFYIRREINSIEGEAKCF